MKGVEREVEQMREGPCKISLHPQNEHVGKCYTLYRTSKWQWRFTVACWT